MYTINELAKCDHVVIISWIDHQTIIELEIKGDKKELVVSVTPAGLVVM